MTTADSHIRSIVDRDGAIILDIRNDAFYSANSTGAYIWSRLIRGESVDQIANALSRDTGIDPAVVTSDVEDFVASLKNKRLFNVCDGL